MKININKINLKGLTKILGNNKKTTVLTALSCVVIGLTAAGCNADKHNIDSNNSIGDNSSSTSSMVQLDSDTKLDSSSKKDESSKTDNSSKASDEVKITFENRKKDKSSSKRNQDNSASDDNTIVVNTDTQVEQEVRGEEEVTVSYDRDDVIVDSNGEVWVVDDSSYPDTYEETEYYDYSEAETGGETSEDDGYFHAPDGTIWTSREEWEEWQRYQTSVESEIGTGYSSLAEDVIYLYPEDVDMDVKVR